MASTAALEQLLDSPEIGRLAGLALAKPLYTLPICTKTVALVRK